MTSCTMCNGFSVRVYMPGRCRTGSSPLSTLIDDSSYCGLTDAIVEKKSYPQWVWTSIRNVTLSLQFIGLALLWSKPDHAACGDLTI